MPVQYVQRMVNFELSDYRAVKDLAVEYGLGSRSFSAAVRVIVREWLRYRDLYFLQREFLASHNPDQPAHQPPIQPELDE